MDFENTKCNHIYVVKIIGNSTHSIIDGKLASTFHINAFFTRYSELFVFDD